MAELIGDGDVANFADFDNSARVASILEGRRSSQTLPVIDFTPFACDGSAEARRSVASQLRAACVKTGFFYLVNHGVSEQEFEIAHDFGHLFFMQPRAEKQKIAKIHHPARQGWMATGGMNPDENPDPDADQKETLNLPRELLPGEPPGNPVVGNGLWPDPARVPGFREFMSAHILKRVRIGQKLCRALSLSLDLPEDFLDEAHRFPNVALTYNYYPPVDPRAAGRTQWGISPHTDYGTFTLLSQDSLGGLEVRDDRNEWIDVPPVPGAFVVNLGDLFSRWTNGVYRSSLHRASNFSGAGRARVSLPLFFNPYPKTVVSCLPSCQGPGRPPKYEPVEAGPYVRALVAQSERTGRPGVTRNTANERFRH